MKSNSLLRAALLLIPLAALHAGENGHAAEDGVVSPQGPKDTALRKTAPALKQAPVDFNHPPREYSQRELQGWQVLVEKELVDGNPELAKSTLARLEKKLGETVAALPASSLPDLRKLKVFLMFGPKAKGGGRDNGLEYFQARAAKHQEWLDPRMERSIVIFNAANYAKLSELWAVKSLVHESAMPSTWSIGQKTARISTRPGTMP